MTPAEMAQWGSVLGTWWRKPLAEALGVNIRSVLRWQSGEFPIPARQAEDIRALCLAIARQKCQMLERLYRASFQKRLKIAKAKGPRPRYYRPLSTRR